LILLVAGFSAQGPVAHGAPLLTQSFNDGEGINCVAIGNADAGGVWARAGATLGKSGEESTFANLDGTKLWGGNNLDDSSEPTLMFNQFDNGGAAGYALTLRLGSDKTNGSFFVEFDKLNIGCIQEAGCC
jgi:hypothetical protein